MIEEWGYVRKSVSVVHGEVDSINILSQMQMVTEVGVSKYVDSISATCGFVIKLIIVVVLAWLSIHSPFVAIGPGVDPSWHFGINAVRSYGLRFGRDILFTYGPLGYLLEPKPIDANICHAVLSQLSLSLMWCALLTYACIKWLKTSRLVIIGLFWLFVKPSAEIYCVVVTTAFACIIASGTRREAMVCTIPACLIALEAAFCKFSLGFATVGAVVIAMILRTIRDSAQAKQVWLLATASTFIFIGVIICSCFGSAGAMLRWIHGGLELSSGYSSAMSIEGPKEEVILALISLAAYVILLLVTVFQLSNQDRYAMIVCIPPMFFFFKHGFVRQDVIHVLSFYSGYLLLLCSLAVVARSDRTFRWLVCLSCFAALTYVSVVHKHWGALPTCQRILGYESLAISKQIVSLGAAVDKAAVDSKHNLQKEFIQDPTVVSLVSAGASVDVIPLDTSVIYANGYRWSPSPVFQHYTAYTRYLDDENARHYGEDDAANILLCRFQSIDDKHMFWDTPATWLSILSNYELVHVTDTGTAVLQRQTSPRQLFTQEFARTSFRADTWIPIPPTDECLFVEIPLSYSFIGFLRKSFFRIPPLYISVAFEDQSIMNRRLVPDTAENGLLMTYLPRNAEEWLQFLQGSASHKAVAFKLVESGTKYCRFPSYVRWVSHGLQISYTSPSGMRGQPE